MAGSYETFKELDLSRDEVERISTALKDKEFRKLLTEYVEEIQNPENKKLYEKEITELEKERGIDVTFINPVAGYVIKTSADGSKKAFVNVCASEHVQKPSSVPMAQDGARGLQWSLPHSISPGREDVDRKGSRCRVFDVVFHPDTLRLAHSNKAFRNMVDNIACDAVESNYDVKLDKKNLKFPKMQYKGMPQSTVIRKPSNEKPTPKTPEEQAILDKVFESIPSNDQKPSRKSKPTTKDDSHSPYTTPKYIIKHRSHIELEEFTEHKQAKLNAAIPRELILEVNLPILKSAGDVTLDVTEKTVQLISEKPAKYKLSLTLPYNVDQDSGNAKFDKDTKKLIVTLPVRRNEDIYRYDSGVESDHASPVEEKCLIKELPENYSETESDFRTNAFLKPDIRYSLPEYTSHLFENTLAFTLHVKNVDEGTLKKSIDTNSLHVTFSTVSSGFYPVHYAFFISLTKNTLNGDTVEVWDNNVIVQIQLETCDESVTSYLVGLDDLHVREECVEEPSVINRALSDEEPSDSKEDVQEDLKPESKAIDIVGALSESSGDELSCSYSPSKCRGILKRFSTGRTNVSRSISESSIDEAFWASSFENCHTSLDSVIPEDGEIATSLKKTVRFNDVVSKQLYRSNSSILGQKKKNQRKARNKKRAQERRHSESEVSELEDRKEGELQTNPIVETTDESNEKRNETNDIFDLDM